MVIPSRIRTIPLLALIPLGIHAQQPTASYSITQVPLPAEMDKQVCISGLNWMNGKLYFASERCPIVMEADASSGAVIRTIPYPAPAVFEMEGVTSYKDKLYLVAENSVAVYELPLTGGSLRTLTTSQPLPPKSKNGDGMEGIAANETDGVMYLLRERNEAMTVSQIWTFRIENGPDGITLQYDSMIELPLANPQWRYSDICYDPSTHRLLCLKSYSKGKFRQQFIETIQVDAKGIPQQSSLSDLPIERFSEISNTYKGQRFSMNLEGITIDPQGTLHLVSDNTSGKALCDQPADERTILLRLTKN